ncbi:MAG TPA: DUF2332 domain-containing protein [Micromonosporaceae bacterium]|nr:DUF2332 domain-containing protein [Micromonosporaceae bacterium]
MPVQDDLHTVASIFAGYAEHEFRGASPRYEMLARIIAAEPELGRPLLAAPVAQRHAILYFAAMQHLVRSTDHPLASWLPTMGGYRQPGAAFHQTFRDFAAGYAEALATICASRRTQTNEAGRCALLRPAFSRVAAGPAAGRPLVLIELGTSAGLLLLPDRYAYRYRAAVGGREEHGGRPDAPAPLVLQCEVRGAGWPDDIAADPAIADRLGIDLEPLDPADSDAADWLRSCIWPEHTDRLARLDAALAEAARVRPRQIRADLVDALEPALAAVASDALPVVFSSNALIYLPPDRLRRLVEVLARVGARRDLAVVINEASQTSVRLFAGVAPPPSPALSTGTLTVVAWRGGTPTLETLGETGAHGGWLSWRPQRWRYDPPG